MRIASRIVVAGLVLWVAWIHLHLWNGGYRHIHTIGALFLLNVIGGAVTAIAVLAAPRRLLPLAGLAAAGFGAATLAALLISVNHGLFGFRDSLLAPFAKESIVAEGLVTAAGLALAALAYMGTRPSFPVGRLSRTRE